MSHYIHLTPTERGSLYAFHEAGLSIRAIARELERSPSTISRELRRGRRNRHRYQPEAAQQIYERKRRKCRRKRILSDPVLLEWIRRLIEEEHWSPEQIVEWARLNGEALSVSAKTIYRAISAGLFHSEWSGYVSRKRSFARHLRRKGKKRRNGGKKRKTGQIVNARPIKDRPEAAANRTETGHLEGDTVAGKHGTGAIVTLVDRKSRMLYAAKVERATAEAVAEAMIQMLGALPPELRRTVTCDRGSEFALFAKVEEILGDTLFYFADAASPWQRGSNENTNGLLREAFPKYSDFRQFSDSEVQAFVYKMNRRPRKCLGWRFPIDCCT